MRGIRNIRTGCLNELEFPRLSRVHLTQRTHHVFFASSTIDHLSNTATTRSESGRCRCNIHKECARKCAFRWDVQHEPQRLPEVWKNSESIGVVPLAGGANAYQEAICGVTRAHATQAEERSLELHSSPVLGKQTPRKFESNIPSHGPRQEWDCGPG